MGAGDDAGFIYQMYGFGLIRELELHQEAGFHPLKVIEHATGNNAKILGQENALGRVRERLLESHLDHCVARILESGDAAEKRAVVDEVVEALKRAR